MNPEALSRFQAVLRDGKRSETTIASYLAHLRAALAWAHDQGMIPAMPKIKRPQRAKKGGRGRKGKGRPITAEEFDRMLAKVPAALGEWRKRKREADRQTPGGTRGRPSEHARPIPIPVEVNPAAVESWRHYLTGLWLSGLAAGRILEPLLGPSRTGFASTWAASGPCCRIPAEVEKGDRDRLLPITPDFADVPLPDPGADRRGPVFRP